MKCGGGARGDVPEGIHPILVHPLFPPGRKYHFRPMSPSTPFWLLAAAFAALAALAGWADVRRGRRRNLDEPGWVPWDLVLVLAMIASVVCLALGVLV